MQGLTKKQDAYGAAMWDGLSYPQAACVIEREDGFVDVDFASNYLRGFRHWAKHERRGMSFARGRVLDVGCGLGRVALHLQEKGLGVVGIDNSPLAIAACRKRGVKDARVLSIARASREALGVFDTIVMYGNNFGLLGSFGGGRKLLRRFCRMTSAAGRIIAQTRDPHLPPGRRPQNEWEKAHSAYRRRNVRRGRMGGQIRFRVRYHNLCTPYLDYLFVSREEMRRMLEGTGWRIANLLDSGTSNYVAVLEKETKT